MLGRTACPSLWSKVLSAAPGSRAELRGLTGSLSLKACAIHSTPASLANPDNKPAPPGKDKNDPTNVKYDTPTKDPDDTSDYAPGYYEDKGKGGSREVGTGSERINSQEQSKHSHQQPVKEDKFKVEEHGDPASGSPKGDDTDLSESTSVSDSKDRTSGKSGEPPSGRSGMPDVGSQTAGMAQPSAPPAQQEAGAYNPPEADAETPASDILEEGGVKPGKPRPARPDEPHKYKYQ